MVFPLFIGINRATVATARVSESLVRTSGNISTQVNTEPAEASALDAAEQRRAERPSAGCLLNEFDDTSPRTT